MAQQQMQAQPPPGAVPPGMRPGMMAPPPTQLPPQTAALLDSLPFNPVAYAYKDAPPRPAGAPPALPIITCKEHGEVVCPRCGINFSDINQLGLVMSLISPGMVPPPPNVQFPNTAESIKGIRDKGNEQFKTGNYPQAAQLYTQSMVMSLNRPPWEQISFVKDEISSAMLNRSVAASKMGAWTAAYADAETCIKMNPRNPKAHFRKATALQGMDRLDEALAALETGLVFEPENAVSCAFSSSFNTGLDKVVLPSVGGSGNVSLTIIFYKKELKNTMKAIQDQLKTEKAAQEPSTTEKAIEGPSTDATTST